VLKIKIKNTLKEEKIYTRAALLRAKRFTILLFISAFGPYMFPQAGLRVEHFFIYGVFGYVIIKLATSHDSYKFNRSIFALLCLWGLTILWIIAISVFNGGFGNLYGALAGLENFLQPTALILITSWYFSRLDQTDLLSVFHTACVSLTVLLSLNSLIAISSIFLDTQSFLNYFVVAGDSGGAEMSTVSQRAATMGRFSGIFNQPLESGLAYSIGILCWVYLANTERKISFSGWVALVLLLLGGAISVSKVFIVVGFPLALLYYGWLNIGIVMSFRKSSLAGFFIMGSGFISLIAIFVDNWTGWSFFIRLFDFTSISDKGFLATYTAGRLDSDETGVMKRFAETWSESPIFGFGLPVEGILDNGYLEFFYLGGSVALTFYILMLFVLLFVALTKKKNNSKFGKFLILFWILTIITGIGAPVFTLNRVSIFFWVLVILSILIVSHRQSGVLVTDVKNEKDNLFEFS
jgi:hypothetical protein